MKKIDGAVVGDILDPLLLGEKNNNCGVELVNHSQVAKRGDHPHDVDFDDVPTLLEKGFGETVRPWWLVAWHLVNGIPSLLL